CRGCDVLVDALFGTVLKTPLSGLFETVVAYINAADLPVVSIDLPSGLSADSAEPPGPHVFFFSSRRRHTRSKRDWSSDVCSSDLAASCCGPWCNAGRCAARDGTRQRRGRSGRWPAAPRPGC